MDSRKYLTKRLIANGFKALLLRYPFEKISIMMITNEADIRRPSFYNHFQDKYDLLAWIVENDVVLPAAEPLRAGNGTLALRTIFSGIIEDAAFYRKAFAVTGQNGFEDSFVDAVQRLFLDNLTLTAKTRQTDLLSARTIARFNAVCLVSTVKSWLESGGQVTNVDELVDAYFYLVSHSVWQADGLSF